MKKIFLTIGILFFIGCANYSNINDINTLIVEKYIQNDNNKDYKIWTKENNNKIECIILGNFYTVGDSEETKGLLHLLLDKKLQVLNVQFVAHDLLYKNYYSNVLNYGINIANEINDYEKKYLTNASSGQS